MIKQVLLLHESGVFTFARLERRGTVFYCVADNPELHEQAADAAEAVRLAELSFCIIVDERLQLREDLLKK